MAKGLIRYQQRGCFHLVTFSNEPKRVEKLRSMQRNPVKRGLVEKPEHWPRSSFRHDATGVIGTVEIESFWTETRRDGLRDPSSQSRDLGHPIL